MNKLYISNAELEQHVLTIARDILVSDWLPDYIVGITRGGLHPANLLSQFLGVPMHSLDVSLRDSASDMSMESNAWMAEDAFNGKNILIVDDINDTGATLQWIEQDWQLSCYPNHSGWENVFGQTVRVATIVDNESSDYDNVSYQSMEINKAEDDVWIVFPWEDWWSVKRL